MILLAGRAPGQQTIWVDADVSPSGNGTQSSPYGTLTEAVAVASAGDTIMLEMSNASYDDQSPNIEAFTPGGITIPAGVKIQLWDADGNVNERARLVTTSGAVTCFRLEGPISAGTTQILTYLTTQPQKVPDTNQGLEIHGFQKGITIDVTSVTGPAYDVSALIDGVAFYGCRQAVVLESDAGSQAITLDLTLQRFLVRVPDSSSSLLTDQPQLSFSPDSAPITGRHDLKVDLVGGDLRTVDRVLQASMVHVDLPRQSDVTLYVQGVAIAGRPAGLRPPPQVYPIEHCGIEVVAGKAEHQVDVQLANVEVHDAQYDGVYVRIKGDKVQQTNTFGTFVAENNCVITENGGAQSVPSNYSESGIHLVAREGGTWSLVRISDSQVNANVRHGLFAEASSYWDQPDKFGSIVLGKSEFRYNGQGQVGRAHGVFVKVMDYDIDSLVIHHVLLANNWTSGFRLDTDGSTQRQTPRAFVLWASNCVLSNNQGQGAVGQYLFDSAPLVLYGVGKVQGTTHLAQLTITDNDAPYAVAVQYEDRNPEDPANPASDTSLWQPGSNVHNCVLNNNGPVLVSGVWSDQAFYPWPTNTAPYDLWQAMFDSTYNSNLGKRGAPKAGAYTTDRQNQYGDPLLVLLAGATDLGLVFPDQSQGSPLVDAGMATTVPNTTNDVRGEPRPDAQTGLKDIGAYEVQQ